MRKFILAFLLISLIYIAYCADSECTKKKIGTITNEENDNKQTSGSNKENQNGDSNGGSSGDSNGDSNGGSSGERRRMEELSQEDCKKLETSDDDKYQCVVSSDKKKCEEVKKENSEVLVLSLTVLLFLFLF